MIADRFAARAGALACALAPALLLGTPGASAAEPKKDKPQPKLYEVKRSANITYYDLPKDPDAYRHKLDVYRPRGKGPFPVLLFLHGGAWMSMSKDDVLGLHGYGTIAR